MNPPNPVRKIILALQAAKNRAYCDKIARAAPTPEGYGPLLQPTGSDRPDWVDPDEIVARHLPMGLSERKARDVATWTHAFRLRSDHPHYAGVCA